MSVLADLLDRLVERLETAEPYAHALTRPFTSSYKRRRGGSPEPSGETGMRRFELTLVQSLPEPAGAAARDRMRVELELRVSYPLADDAVLAARYFSEECALLRRLVLDPQLWADGRVRIVDYVDSRMAAAKGRWLVFTHRLAALTDDTSETEEG
jgi:hypothetical protein